MINKWALTTIVLTLIIGCGNTMATNDAIASKSPYRSGYDHGCDDADISDADDRYINQPEKGFGFHTEEFNQGYIDGFCDNSPPGRGSDADEATFSCP